MKKFLLIICFLLMSFSLFAENRIFGFWKILNDTPAVAIEILPDGNLFIIYYTGIEIKHKHYVRNNLFFLGSLGYYFEFSEDENLLKLIPAFGEGFEIIYLERKTSYEY